MGTPVIPGFAEVMGGIEPSSPAQPVATPRPRTTPQGGSTAGGGTATASPAVNMSTQVEASRAAEVLGQLLNKFSGGMLGGDASAQALTAKTAPPSTTPTSTQALTSGGSHATPSYTGGTSTYTGATTQEDFFRAVLQGIGAPATDENLRFMRAWSQWEIPDPSYYNPFATTQDASGATSINSVGVRRYPDFQTGVNATIQTLQNGNYQSIIDQLMAGDSSINTAIALANTPWGSGNGPLQILQGG